MPLTTLQSLPRGARPGHETETELARRLWSVQRTLMEVRDDLEAFCNAGGDLHGGDDPADTLVITGTDLAATMRVLARHLDRTAGDYDF